MAGELHFHWMDQEPAPKALMELVSCKCKTGCSGRRCSCHKVGLMCTDVCDCIGCENSGFNPGNDSDGDILEPVYYVYENIALLLNFHLDCFAVMKRYFFFLIFYSQGSLTIKS